MYCGVYKNDQALSGSGYIFLFLKQSNIEWFYYASLPRPAAYFSSPVSQCTCAGTDVVQLSFFTCQGIKIR